MNLYLDYLEEPSLFNEKLMEYLIWYNTDLPAVPPELWQAGKPHRGIANLPPLRYYLDNFITTPQKSNMLWTLIAP